MKGHKHLFSVERMSHVLGVSKQGFYRFLHRAPSLREQENTRLVVALKKAHLASRRTYGHRRLYKELNEQGVDIGKKRVIRLMKSNNIVAKAKKPFRLTTDSSHGLRILPNILEREFSARQPNQKWVSDISYIPTGEGFLYLAVIIDLFSRLVVGIHMATSMTQDLILNAFEQALVRRGKPTNFIFHSDQGSQYACDEFKSILKSRGVEQSMSRKGNCWDNAVAESFFGTLKLELMSDHKFSTRNEARSSIFEYVEVFYNRKRSHSTLGYLPPEVYEAEFYAGRFTVN
jgi:putative transposase